VRCRSLPEDGHRANVWFAQQGRNMEKGGLAGSIRSDQGQCFTRPDREMVYVE